MNLSQKIKQLREEKGFSLGKLAETAEVSKAYLSQLENNVSKHLQLKFCSKLLRHSARQLPIFLTNPCVCMRKTSTKRFRGDYSN